MRPVACQRGTEAQALTGRVGGAWPTRNSCEARGLRKPPSAWRTTWRARSVGALQELPGPVGERNVYVLKPRGRVVALADSEPAALLQLGAILATGNRAILEASNPAARTLAALPADIAARIDTVPGWQSAQDIAARAVCRRSARHCAK